MKFRQNQRSKLREHFRDHAYYKLCRAVQDVFQQYEPSIIMNAEELFVDAAKTLDRLLTEGDLETERCSGLWSDTLRDYREKDGTCADMAVTQAEVAMLFYAVIHGLLAVNLSHYRKKLASTLHQSIHQMWNRHGTKNCKAVEEELTEVTDALSDSVYEWMHTYFSSGASLTDEIDVVLHPKKAGPSKKEAKTKEKIYYTLPYNCKDEATRVERINIVMRKMQEWGWIEEPQYADDFFHLFDGEPRECNIKWIGRPLAILTELMKRLLKQPYMGKVKGLAALSIVKNQFGKNRSGNAERLDETSQRRIMFIICILDYNKPLPLPRNDQGEDMDIGNLALQSVFSKDLHITKDLNHRYD